LQIDNLSPAILNLQNGNKQEIVVTPDMVSDSDTWSGIISGQSIKTGNFSVQVKVEPPIKSFIIPVFPVGHVVGIPEFSWFSNNNQFTDYEILVKQKKQIDNNTEDLPVIANYNTPNTSFVPEDPLPPINPDEEYVWYVKANSPSETISSAEISFTCVIGPEQATDDRPGEGGDPCEDPEYVEKENKECADIIDEKVNKPFHTGPELDFDNFKDEWQEYFRMLTQTMVQFDLQLSMIKYWIDAGDEIDKQAQDVQKLAGLIKKGIGHGTTAFKKGGEEAMKEMAQGFTEDQVKEFEQHAANQVSSTLGALYDLEDLAIRRIGLGIAKGITGVYPDKMADHYRRQLQVSTSDLTTWVSNRRNWGSGHPTLQDGISEMCDLLNQLDQIERDFEKAVSEAGFICIECEIPPELREDMEKLRLEIESHIRMFGDSIDQIRQRLVEARGIANNKKAYEDIARLGSFQANSQKQTREINRVLDESKTEFQNALNTRKN
jgi:hypothetical protein